MAAPCEKWSCLKQIGESSFARLTSIDQHSSKAGPNHVRFSYSLLIDSEARLLHCPPKSLNHGWHSRFPKGESSSPRSTSTDQHSADTAFGVGPRRLAVLVFFADR